MEILGKLERDLRDKKFIVMLARCSVSYEGRARSFLGIGDRLIVIKNDSTVIVHQPVGGMHVNYMKNAYISVNGSTIIARGSDGRERLIIEIEDIYDYSSRRMIDNESITLSGDEREMQEYIYKHPDIISRDFKPLSREAITRYGYIDILGVEQGSYVVVECKRIKAGMPDVEQLHRYVERFKKEKGVERVIGVMIAPSISDPAYRYLMDKGYRFVRFSPPGILKKQGKRHKDLNQFLNGN